MMFKMMFKFFQILLIVLLLIPGFVLAADSEKAPRAVPGKEYHEIGPEVRKLDSPLLETPAAAKAQLFSPQSPKISASENQEPFAEIEIALPAEEKERKNLLKAFEDIGIKGPQDSVSSEVVLEVSPIQEKKLYQSGIKYKVIRYGIKVSGGINSIDAPK